DLLHSQRSPVSLAAHTPQDQATTPRRALAEVELARLSKEARGEPLLLADVIAGICKLLESRLQQRCMILKIDALDTVSPVLADRTLLRQAFLNLLSYALNVLQDGSALALSAEDVAGTVHLRLHQTIAGAPGDQSATPARSSEGVAVAVAQSLIAAQNGRLILDETPGAWSAEITLPTAQAATVLIVDDNQDLVELFQRYLAGHRLTVLGVSNGAEALTSIQQSLPQAIVLDVMMPHQDGWELLQLLRQTPACATIPIIVCSVLRERDLALALGASDTLIKPVSQSALLDALRRWLGSLHPLE
nr:response regulator [Caldilineaceae bacterium]